MAKRSKPIDDGFNTIDVNKKIKKEVNVNQNTSTLDQSDESSLQSKQLVVVSTTAKEKIDENQKLQEQISSLIQERDDLLKRLEEYILEIKNLKENKLTLDIQSNSEEIENLKSINESYIERISQLIFENASLKNKVDELTSSKKNVQENIVPSNIANSQSNHRVQEIRNFTFPNRFSNGYSSWN